MNTSASSHRRVRFAAASLLVVAVAVGAPVGRIATASPRPGLAATSNVADAATATKQATRVGYNATKPIFPMQTTPRCNILDNFGDPRPGGRIHQGTDMLATLGQEVYAVVDGTLGHQVKVGDPDATLSGNAWQLTVAGGKTWYAFMHLSAFAAGLSNGSVVKQGQVIGYVGDTGDAGPGNYHLHFEVHPNGGAAINALTVLSVPSDCTVT